MIMYRLSDYRHIVTPVLEKFRDRDHIPPLDRISLTVQMTQVPLLCVAEIYKELYGTSEVLESFIEKLKKFYQSDIEEETP